MKADAKRAALLEKLVQHVLAHGLAGASLRPLAAATGTSDRMLIYYFGDKATLIASIIQTAAGQLAATLDAAVGPERRSAAEMAEILDRVTRGPAVQPYMRLWLEIAALSAFGDQTCRAIGGEIVRGFIMWIGERLDVPADERELTAARLLREADGAMLLDAVGLAEINDRLAAAR